MSGTKKKFDLQFILITLFILYTSYGSTWVMNDAVTACVFLFVFLAFVFTRQHFDSTIILVIAVWLLINFLSANFINTHEEFSYISLIGVTIRIVMPYMIVKICGINFFDRLIKYVYVLAIISLILFGLQTLNKGIFYAMAPTLNFMTQEVQHDAGGWYIFIYMFSAWASDRNCGFAWEPGAYACVLVFLLCYQLVKNRFQLDKYVSVFLISLITTFSTSGYLCMFLILIALFLYKDKRELHPAYFLGLIVFIIFSFFFFQTSEFMEKKIIRYYENQKNEYTLDTGQERINRVEEFNRGLEQSLEWPLGNGVLTSEFRKNKYGNAVGPNSLSSILTQWGWLGLIGFLLTTIYFYNFFAKRLVVSCLLTLSCCIVLYSNPFMMRYLVYAIMFYYFLYIKKVQRIVKDDKKIAPIFNLSK
jgi:hypothetical protein